MNKIKIMAGALIGCAMAFTACSDDLSHNPTLQTPETFTLNTPAYSTSNIDLETTDSMRLTWSQPDYGFPAAAQYEVQVSLNDDWSVSTEQAAADESGKTKPTYATVSDPTGVCSTSVIGSTLAKGIQTIGGWGEDDIPAKKDVKVRVMSVYAKDTIYSNVINLTVVPYFVKDVVPMGWYLIGSCIGDGSWGGEIGPNMIPMYAIAGQNYDKKTGEGKFSWTGYLTTEGFKLKKEADKWDDQIGQKKGDDGTLEYDADGNPIEGSTVLSSALYQSKGNGGFMLDLSIGRSIRLKTGQLSINLSLTNLLNNTKLCTGGYEQSRSNYSIGSTDGEVNTSRLYRFDKSPKKYYAWGINGMLNIGYRF
jgi:hypothetical protein